MRTDSLNIKIKSILSQNVKKVLIKTMFPWRNSFILFNLSNKAKNNKVNLGYWDESVNLGDTLSPIIVNHMLSLKGISPDVLVEGRKHLYAVGSVLTAGIQDATVWGSGVLNASLTYRLEGRKLDIRAVRGPITRAVLMDYGYDASDVYGDPAILLPEVYTPKNVDKKAKYGLIVHKDYDTSKAFSDGNEVNDVIHLNICTDDYREFIDQLTSVEVVISSSLHGIILAEAYGVNAVLLKPQVDFLKYYDYYYSTERFAFPIAKTLDEAKQTVPIELPDFSELRNKLKSAFPYDIYTR